MARTRSAHRIHAMEYARQLASQFGCGRSFEPVECWTVQNDVISKVKVVMVRGHCDNRESSYDYADTDDRQSISARYIFPAKSHKRPRLTEGQDDFGTFNDWTSDPKK